MQRLINRFQYDNKNTYMNLLFIYIIPFQNIQKINRYRVEI